jgi:CheY-like chemotaxis protein/two-component sensor histidine kinase
LEALGQLAGGIAHDFNNVLSIIGGYATVLKRKTEAKSDLGIAAQRIQEGVERAAAMTREMLTFSRRNPANARSIDLARIVAGQGTLLKPLLGADVRLEIDAGDAIVPVRIDPNLLAQTIMNLAINARDAMPRGGTLRIGVVREDGKASIVVSDTGLGMDEATLGRIFEPFFTTKAPGKGTGLGLAMVYGIVTQFGGTVDATSAPGKGTTFTLRFPTTEEPIVEDVVAATPVRSAGGETILVAEDEPALLALVCKTLEEAGYVALAAANGVDALEIADAARESGRKIDLLLTDLVMPGLSGLKLAALIQELDPDTQIVYMTGYPSRYGYAQGEIPKGATVLYKPLDLDRLLAGVASALAAKRRNAAAE